MLLNKNVLAHIDMSGRGGKEKQFQPAMPGYERVNDPLRDFVNEETNHSRELKKQQNLQWFDVGKYHNLSNAEKQIGMVFVLHKDKKIQDVFEIDLGNMLSLLVGDEDFRADGWTTANIADCHAKKIQHPTMQVKVPLKVKSFVSKYKSHFYHHYSRCDIS
tara:strand:+ start:336 stop:818 length:483 start_codon:yes stop_codon:yes gene_type:complete